MNKTKFLIETLRHTIADLLAANLNESERELLALMATTDEFNNLFGIRNNEPELPQLSERAFSELTGNRFNTLFAATDLVQRHGGYCTREGYCIVKYRIGNDWFLPETSKLVFRLIDEGSELVSIKDTLLAVYMLTNTETKEAYRLNFEVCDQATAIELMHVIRGYLPAHLAIAVKKL